MIVILIIASIYKCIVHSSFENAIVIRVKCKHFNKHVFIKDLFCNLSTPEWLLFVHTVS